MPHDIWRALFENALEGMLLATPEGAIIAANPAACRMFRRTEAELCQLGRSPETVVMDDAFIELAERRRKEGHARGHATLRRGDGTTFTADMSGVAFDGPDGPRIHIMLIDVTEQVRTLRALEVLAQAGRVLGESLEIKATMRRFTSLVVPRLADICILDLIDGENVEHAIAHRDPTQVELVREVRRRSSERAGLVKALRTGRAHLVSRNTDGEEHLDLVEGLGVTSFLSVPLVARGTILGAFTLASTGGVADYDAYDLALANALGDQAALAIDNARTHDMALKATRLRDEVLEVVSHDLKNPLNTIKLSAGSLAKRRTEDEEVPIIRRAVERAERLIQDLLDASKMDFTTIVLDPQPTSVRALLTGVLALHKKAAEEKSLDLVTLVTGVADTIVVDHHRVAQMLDNLVSNAIKFTERGSIELRARVTTSVVVFEVQDTGAGIEHEVVDRIFDRFWQGAHAGRTSAGLGLAIARGIARAHGGELVVESALGHGTTFIATLPNTRR